MRKNERLEIRGTKNRKKRFRILEDEDSVLAPTLSLHPPTSIHREGRGPGSKFSHLQEQLATHISFLHKHLGSSGCSGAPLAPFTDLHRQMGMVHGPLATHFSIFS